jgi:hypothetical protein
MAGAGGAAAADLKVCVLGPCRVGKTLLCRAVAQQPLAPAADYEPTAAVRWAARRGAARACGTLRCARVLPRPHAQRRRRPRRAARERRRACMPTARAGPAAAPAALHAQGAGGRRDSRPRARGGARRTVGRLRQPAVPAALAGAGGRECMGGLWWRRAHDPCLPRLARQKRSEARGAAGARAPAAEPLPPPSAPVPAPAPAHSAWMACCSWSTRRAPPSASSRRCTPRLPCLRRCQCARAWCWRSTRAARTLRAAPRRGRVGPHARGAAGALQSMPCSILGMPD